MKTIFTFLGMLLFTAVLAQDKIFVHTATTENISADATFIDHPDLNGNPSAGILEVHNFSPLGVYNDRATGLFYSSTQNKWTIYNEDSSPMVENSSYNVYIGDPSNFITHIATVGNQGSFGGYTTVIDDPDFNGSDPGPYAVFSTYYNPNSERNDNQFGFYYDTALDKRGIYEEGTTTIPDGAAFKILKTGGTGTNRTTHVASAANTSGHITTIDHPDLNGNPDGAFVFSHYWGVNGPDTQVSLDANLSVWYNGSNWTIYCEDTTVAIPENLAFDIIIADREVLGVEENQLVAASVTMFPNPTSGVVTFDSKEVISNIGIYNILGQEVKQISGKNSNNLTIDISGLAAGNYIAKVQAGTAVESVKLIKL
ncbi:T9SS type A sorting domain-containing protein [uncultured Marixanthomonas sp.]|uniref:T9SS type A sorting domain-containing protein n=1 Tax=uncultured Marixanthomonas sp. TaxID=757245 RepID=UPI0030D9EA9F